MLRSILLLSLLIISATVSAQNTKAIDSLLMDARLSEAVSLIDKELATAKTPEQSVRLQNKKAEALIGQGKFDQADKILKDAQRQDASNPFTQGITQTTTGLLYLNQGRNDLALTNLQTALDNFEKAGKPNSLEASQALSNLGNLYRTTGKYTQAEEQLNMALADRQRLLKQNHELIAASYNDLGLVYYVTDANKATEYY